MGDGASALAAAPDFRPDIALLDIGLPGIDGYRLAEQLQALPEGAPTRLVALTGYGMAEDRQRSRDARFAEHLVKPVDAGLLQRILGRGRPGRRFDRGRRPFPSGAPMLASTW